MVVDTVLTYQFIKKLTTPFNQLPAYRLHLIDEKGNFLKARNQFTNQEKNACGLFDVMIINLKKLIALIPGGASRMSTVAATLLLLRSKPIKEDFNNNELEEEFFKIYNALLEDGAVAVSAPVNSAGSGDIAAIGQPPGSLKGFPPVSIKNKYKDKNLKDTKKMMRGILGAVNVTEVESHSIEKTFRDDYLNKNFKQELELKKVPKILKKFSKFKESSTLEYHDMLNPKIWDGAVLKSEVRGKLLQIADAWRDFAKIHPDTITDIILTGGNANYNYTPQSDLDLHLIINRGEFNGSMIDRAFVDEYLQDKKILWTLTHSGINIYGYPVELYAQDINDQPHSGQGVYSVMHDHWIQEPEYLNLNFESDPNLQDKVDFYKDMIDKLIDQQADSDSIDTLKERIKSMRGDSIAQGGEFAFGNLVFKELRNAGYLDKLSDYDKSRKDKALSL